MPGAPGSDRGSELIAALRAEPGASAIFSDLDGTLAPIVPRPDQVRVPPEATELLARLAASYSLVGCVSGRRAAEARAIVGLDELVYIGNHGFEHLDPGAAEPRVAAAVLGHERDAAMFAERQLPPARLAEAGLRAEDKGPILALHWRGAHSERRAEEAARKIAAEAADAGLVIHRGRKVLELRPRTGLNKGVAVAELVERDRIGRALYAGDDRTDVDVFRALRAMRDDGRLEVAVGVGIASAESPPEVGAEADLLVADPPSLLALLEGLTVERKAPEASEREGGSPPAPAR